MRIYATLSCFATFIQALEHAVTIHALWDGSVCLRLHVFCIHVCVDVHVHSGRVHVLYMCVMKTKWWGV